MFSANRISKKTFFAAAALGIAAAVPAHAYLFEEEVINDLVDWRDNNSGGDYQYSFDYHLYRIDSASTQTTDLRVGMSRTFVDSDGTSSELPGDWVTFIKTGSGVLQARSLLTTGGSLYNSHHLGYTNDGNAANDGPVYQQERHDNVIQPGASFEFYTAACSEYSLDWLSGEVVVDEGVLNLTGYVNTWFDFGSAFNKEFLGRTSGKMLGASRITVRNGAVLDLAGNNNFLREDVSYTDLSYMVAPKSFTTFQFLHNLQAGDTGADLQSALALGTSTAYHVNVHIDGWSENERINTGVASSGSVENSYFDSALAFGGSIGTVSGAGSIYKTGAGAFTLLGANSGFTGGLYAAGGSLVLAGTDSVGLTEEFTDAFGNAVRVQVSSSVGNASSVNIAGTMNTGKEANGGSMQGSAIGRDERYQLLTVVDGNEKNFKKEYIWTSVKESYFTPPSAGTLVVAENQIINNFQAYFAAGVSVSDGTSASAAVLAAANSGGVLAPRKDADFGTSDAPVIAGTGVGSQIVIPGGNYTVREDGSYSLNTDENGYMKGGVLVINQESGKGGVYAGSIVGARVAVYDKTTFYEQTEDSETDDRADSAARLAAVRLGESALKVALAALFPGENTNTLYSQLNVDANGSFALDNEVALAVVDYFKNSQTGTQYYVDYQADAAVKGGMLVLKGAGDVALLLETANYSGIHIDDNRTGKTVLNITAVNSLEGSDVVLGGRGIVSFVVNQSDTLKVKLNGFYNGSRLVFTTADLINTVSGRVKVGDSRKAEIGFAQTQEDIYSDLYIERGVALNLSGDQSTFTNAHSVTLWSGASIGSDASTTAAPSLTIFEQGSAYANQFVNNLTGDSAAFISLGRGALTVNVTDNSKDGYSGLDIGTYDGTLSGVGTFVKDGDSALTLGGGDHNRSFTGTMEVAAGTLVLSKTNSLSGAGALILNDGTSASMSGDQHIRALYGSKSTSVTAEGTLTLGADVVPATGENRPLVTNNLGTSSSGINADAEASFARFKNCYDLKGNLVLADDAAPAGAASSQKDATTAYLTAVSRLAYSGFDASVLAEFVGVKDYNGDLLLTKASYNSILAYAKSNGGADSLNATVMGATASVRKTSMLSDLADQYTALKHESDCLALFKATANSTTGGFAYYSPEALKTLKDPTTGKRLMTDVEYRAFTQEIRDDYALANPVTLAQREAFNQVLFEKIRSKYEELTKWNLDKASAANASTEVFAGIPITGAFANEVRSDGTLVDADWIREPAFAGTLKSTALVKTGDDRVSLTGTVETSKINIEAGTLEIRSASLAEAVADGISVSRTADLAVNVAAGEDATFNTAISGSGNFIKTGAGKLTLDETATYSGTTTIEGGTLQMTLREPRTTTTDGVTSTLLPQTDIYLDGDGVAVIFDQPTDVSWGADIEATENAGAVAVAKIGAGTLTLTGNVSLAEADSATLEIGAGTLKLTGTLVSGGDADVRIASGATLDIAGGSTDLSAGTSFSGEGALSISGGSSAELKGIGDSVSVVANGDGLVYDAFYGTVRVYGRGSSLTLSGESVFSHARAVEVQGAASLTVAAGTRQTLRSLAGSGSLALEGDLEVVRNGDRIAADYSSGSYVFKEDVLISSPRLSGNISGAGTLTVGGSGASSFSGDISSEMSVRDGGQLVLNTETFMGSVTVDGAKITVDKDGNKIVCSEGTNYSSGLAARGNGYLPRTIVNELGEEVDVSGFSVYASKDKTAALYKDADGKEHTVVSVKSWDFGVSDELSANWGVKRDGKFVDSSALSDAIVWKDGAYTLAEGCSLGYKALAEDALGNLVVTSLSGSKELAAEVVFLVDPETKEVALGSDKLGFANGGRFGKVGGGTLLADASAFADCGGITVYAGTLKIDGWVSAEKVIAQDATLAVNLSNTDDLDFMSVIGSGTFEISAEGQISIVKKGAGGLAADGKEVLPTTDVNKDGKFFNGKISFTGACDVTISGNGSDDMLEMASVGADETVRLSVGFVKFVQTQNSEVAGELNVVGDIEVAGTTNRSGQVLSRDLRRLTVGDFKPSGANGVLLENVGFGFSAAQSGGTLEISEESCANTIFVDLDSDSTDRLVAAGTSVKLEAAPNAKPTGKLNELSFVKTGSGALTLTGTAIAGLGVAQNDAVFGVDKKVYEELSANGGVFNIGVESGTLTLKDLPTDGALFSGNGTNVNLVTLRSAVSAETGTLVVSAEKTSAGFVGASAETPSSVLFAETVKGGGNAEFFGSPSSALKVTAAQEYTGQTLISSGKVEFSGAGRDSKSSNFTVVSGATLCGGVNLLGRTVKTSVSALRNASASGAPGTTSLTVSLDDERLPSVCRFFVSLSEDGTALVSAPTALGVYPAGVGIDKAELLDGKTLRVTLTDAAYGDGETYTVDVALNAVPETVDGRDSYSSTTTVSGNFALSSGGNVYLDAAAGDSISVGAGTVTLEGNLFVENLNESVRGKTIKLVSAASVTGGADSRTGTKAVVDALRRANSTLSSEDKMKLAVFTDSASGAISATMLIDDFASAGSDYNDGVSGSFLDALSEIASTDASGSSQNIINFDDFIGTERGDLFFALNSLTSDRLAEEVNKLSPISFASMLTMPVEAFNSDVARIHARLDQRRYDGANPLRETGEYEFFALAQSDFAENDSAHDAPAFDYNLYGISAGFDWKPNFETTFGVALGYTYGKAKIHDGGGKITMDDVRLTAFFSRTLGAGAYVDAGIQAGAADFDTRRNTVAGTAKGDTDSLFCGAFVMFGKAFTLYHDKKDGSGLYFTPSIGLSWLHTEIDGFEESGTAGLKMDDADGDSLRARIAAGLQWAFPTADWDVRIGAEIAYSHEFLGEELDMDGRFAAGGSKFGVSANAMATDVFSFGPTIDVMVTERTSLYFGYEIDIDTDSGISQGVNAGFRHRF